MKKLLVLLFLGLLLRLFLSVQFYSGDVNNHISWGKDILLNGFQGIYEREFYFRYGTLTPNYPPITLFLFAFSYWLYQALYNLSWWLNEHISVFPSNIIFFFQGINTIPAFLKLPAILADIGIAYYIYLFARRLINSEKWSLIAASLVLFNPAFFYNSALWGQIEALPTLFVLAAFYSLLYSKKATISALFFTLALLSKQNAIIFAPIFILIFWKKYSVAQIFKSGLASIILFWILFLPFNSWDILKLPFEVYWNKILTNSVSDYVTYHAFNFWTLFVGFDRIHDSTIFLLGLPYQMWGYIIFFIFSFIILYKLWRKMDDYRILLASTLISFASFLFLTRLHERHLEPTIPFLLLVSIKEKKMLPIFIFVSLFYVINLYQNWWAPRIPTLVNILSDLGVIKLLVFGLLGAFTFLFSFFQQREKRA